MRPTQTMWENLTDKEGWKRTARYYIAPQIVIAASIAALGIAVVKSDNHSTKEADQISNLFRSGTCTTAAPVDDLAACLKRNVTVNQAAALSK